MSRRPIAYAVILAGGGGTRLWPASRRARPKQLLKLGAAESLLAATVRRLQPIFGLERTLVVTARDQENAIAAELPALPRNNILAEPAPRNTSGAIQLAAAFATLNGGPNSLLAVVPADQHVGNERAFRARVRVALRHAPDAIVTIGVRPTAPETGYGYIRLGAAVNDDGTYAVREFVEKPDLKTARRYLRSGKYAWNAGMFFLSAERMRHETERHLPKLHRFFERVTASGSFAPKRFRAAVDEHYGDVEAISIDYGVMEKASGLLAVSGDFGWSDVGSWSAVGELAKQGRNCDADGNVTIGDALIRDGGGNIVVSEPGAPFVGVVGVRDLVVVATKDGVLVVPRERSQDVRLIVDALKQGKRSELL